MDDGETKSSFSKRLFVSYTGSDTERATWIADTLRAAGHRVTIQAWDFIPGRNLVLEMQHGLTTSDHTIAVLSPAYEASAFASAEWAAAFYSDPTGKDRRLLGVRVVDYQPSGLLAPLVYVDLVGAERDEASATSRLLAGIAAGEPIQSISSSQGPRHYHRLRAQPALFEGRHDELRHLSSNLEHGKRGVVALTGLGGIGKTSVAAAWAEANADRYDVAVWILASDEGQARLEIHSLAVDLGLVSDTVGIEDSGQALATYLKSVTHWLVVLDGCSDPGLPTRLLPANCGHILVTSRVGTGWSSAGIPQLSITPWSIADSVAYLTRVCPSGGDGAETIADALDGFPLAIAQAAAYVDIYGLSFADYLERLTTSAPRVFDDPLGDVYPDTVMTVWDLALDQIAQEIPAADALLQVLSVVGDQDFPRTLLSLGAQHLPLALAPVAADPFELDRALAALLRHSFCRIDGDGVSVHAVVQGVVWTRMSAEQRSIALRAMASVLGDAEPDREEHAAWADWEGLAPHITAVAARCLFSDTYVPELNQIVTDLGYFMLHHGYSHFGAALMHQQMRYLVGHADDARPDDVATAISNAGDAMLAVRVPAQAADLYRSAMSLDAALGHDRSPRSAGARVGLASALTDLQEHDEAEVLLTDAIEILGTDGPPDLVVRARGTLGRLLNRQGRFDEALTHLTEALEESRRSSLLRDEALTLLHLGNVRRLKGDLDGGRADYESGLGVAAALGGAEDLQADLYCNLAAWAEQVGDDEAVRSYVSRGLSILATTPDGLSTVSAAQLLYAAAINERSNGNRPGALLLAERSYEILLHHSHEVETLFQGAAHLLSDLRSDAPPDPTHRSA